jgi:hypothetical protein
VCPGHQTEHVAGHPVGREQEQPVRRHRSTGAGRVEGTDPAQRMVTGRGRPCTSSGLRTGHASANREAVPMFEKPNRITMLATEHPERGDGAHAVVSVRQG